MARVEMTQTASTSVFTEFIAPHLGRFIINVIALMWLSIKLSTDTSLGTQAILQRELF